MGTYLSTNLWARMSIKTEDVKDTFLNQKQLSEFLKSELDFHPDIYEYQEIDEKILFQLKPEVLASEFIPFLESFYEAYYQDSVRTNKALEELKGLAPEKWGEYIEQGDSYHFDTYKDYFSIGNQDIQFYVDVQYWRLTLEGKVMAEEIGAHIRLFEYALKNAFHSFRLSKALEVFFV